MRTADDPKQAIGMMRRDAQAIDPDATVFDTIPLSEYIGASLYPQKIAANLLSVLGILALLLAGVGLHSVMAYSVTQRTHEIGVRIALGARSADVLLLLVRRGMALTIAGLLLGFAPALILARNIAGVLISESAMGGGHSLLSASATDPMIYLGAALFLSIIATLASYIPARRATRVDPIIAWRYE